MTLQLWSNVRNAFGDQPDSVELAETLSQNFESLYDKEVGFSCPLSLDLSSAYCIFLSYCCWIANVVDATQFCNWLLINEASVI